jgi:hypothetical protein
MNRIRTRIARFALLASIAAVPCAWAASDAPKRSDALPAGAHDFDFQFGQWRVHHRVLKPGAQQWVESEGTSSARPIMGGYGNVEDNVFHPPSGTYHAVGLRAFDPKTGLWAIWWVDGRAPHGPVDPPVKGRFENGVGNFYSDDVVNGKPLRTRYQWSRITPKTAHWEQATSSDAGETWDTNWVMDFQRTGM